MTLSTGRGDQQKEVDRNYESFKEQLGALLKTDAGRTALMQDGKVVACFDTDGDAIRAGRRLLKGPFSIQEITSEPIDLGYYSYVGNLRHS